MQIKRKDIETFLSEREAETLEDFREKVREMQARKAYFRELERLNPSLTEISNNFSSRKPVKKNPTNNPIERTEMAFIDPCWLLRKYFGEDVCPKPRSFDLKFYKGYGGGEFSDVPDVTGVRNGYVGWENLHEIKNASTTGREKKGYLRLMWEETLPVTGIYGYKNTTQIRIAYDQEVSGSGFWGLDALLTVTYHPYMFLTNPDEYRYLGPDEYTILTANSSSFLGATQIGWLEGGWFNIVGNGFFEGKEGDTIFLVVELSIYTWADDGDVEIGINDFWIPSNTGHDIVLIDY